MARGWSDGLPVVPPYRTLVDRMLEHLSWRAGEVVGTIDELHLEVRADQLAATAVMAGCEPRYGPLLRALSLALLDPAFNLGGVAVTTGGPGVLVVVSGPIVAELGFACGSNVLASPARPNATVGRFANLVMRFCGLADGTREEFGTLGHPGRIAYCLPERPQPKWEPFHTQLGLPAQASAVAIFAAEGPNSVNNHYAESGDLILETIADAIGHAGATSYYYRRKNVSHLVLLAPEHLELVAARFSRAEARRFLFQHAVRPTDELLRLGRLPRTPRIEEQVEPGTMRAPFEREEQILFVDAGGPAGKFSAVIPCWVGNRTVARTVAHTIEGP